MSKSRKDLIGQRFGRLVVTDTADDYVSPKGSKSVMWKCHCDCGNDIVVRQTALINNGQQSCGCVQREKWKINCFEDVLPVETLIDLYVNKHYSLSSLQEIYKIQKPVIAEKLRSLGVEIRDAHDDVYYESRRKYEDWQTGSREYNKIMEKYLGRPLDKNEVVHHIDCNRENNDLSNLFVFGSSSMHLAYHGYIKCHPYLSPQDFVDRYGSLYEKVFSESFLYEEYINQHKSIAMISRENQPISRLTITKKLKEYGLFDLRPKSVNQYRRNAI